MAIKMQLGVLLLLVAVQLATAAHWGDFARSGCQRPGFRKWYSRLWDIKGDWNRACQSTPATVNNFYFPRPDNCVDKGAGGMWGEFYVPDGGCKSLWSEFRKSEGCSQAKPGFAKFVARLQVDVSKEESLRGASRAWSSYVLCRGKEAFVEGVHFTRPDQCVYKGAAEGMYGEFFIRDFGCDMGAAIEEVV